MVLLAVRRLVDLLGRLRLLGGQELIREMGALRST